MVDDVKDFAAKLQAQLPEKSKQIPEASTAEFLQLVFHAALTPEEQRYHAVRAVLLLEPPATEEYAVLTKFASCSSVDARQLAKIASSLPEEGEFIFLAAPNLLLWGTGQLHTSARTRFFSELDKPRIRAWSTHPGVLHCAAGWFFAARFRGGVSEFLQRDNQAITPITDFLVPAAKWLENLANSRNTMDPGTFPPLTEGYGKAAMEYFTVRLYQAVEAAERGGTLLFVPHGMIAELRQENVLSSGHWIAQERPVGHTIDAVDKLITAAANDYHVMVRANIERGHAWSWSETQGQLNRADNNGLAGNLNHALQSLGSIAAQSTVDGAVIIDEFLRVHAFGVKLSPKTDCPEKVTYFQLRMGEHTVEEGPVKGGTRHRSAITMTNTFHEVVAVVFSADGGNQTSYWYPDKNGTWIVVQDL